MSWPPPVGRPTGVTLCGGPSHGEVRNMAGTHAVATPIMRRDGTLYWFEGSYKWNIDPDSLEITGRWQNPVTPPNYSENPNPRSKW